MNSLRNTLRQLWGIAGLILLGIVLIILFQWGQKYLIARQPLEPGAAAYPPPGQTEPAKILQATPSPYPWPEDPGQVTPVVQDSPTPYVPQVPPPPPGWPTDEPWPPDPSRQTPYPTRTVLPFPTPVYLPDYKGEPLDSLAQLWFPYFPKSDADPQLWALEYDRDNRQLKTAQLPIHLPIPAPQTGPDPGPVLLDLHLSPDSRWLVADFAYRMSLLIDLSTGDPRVPAEGFEIAFWRFFTWVPGDIPRMIASDEEFPEEAVQIVDLDAAKAETLVIRNFIEDDNATIRALAYSPDGKKLANAVVYPATKDIRKTELAIVGLVGEERQVVAEIDGGGDILYSSMKWSPDGNYLIWITCVYYDKRGYSEDQLWMTDLRGNTSKVLNVLGRSVQYDHPPTWSPDGSMIAVIKVEGVKESKEDSSNLYLIDPETGEEKQVTHFTDRRLSHLQWLPSGWIAFTLSTRTYSEIWVTNPDGSVQFPVAGPTLPNAPFIWLSK